MWLFSETRINHLRILSGIASEAEISADFYEKGAMIELIAGSLTGLHGEQIQANQMHKVVINSIRPAEQCNGLPP